LRRILVLLVEKKKGPSWLVASLKVIRSLIRQAAEANLAEDGMGVGAEVKGEGDNLRFGRHVGRLERCVP